jgi:DEAD/DEAH box helicase domain-containing protein
VLAGIMQDPELAGRVVHEVELPEQLARHAPIPAYLHEDVRARLTARKISALWTHQAAAVDELHAGRHVVVATGTASGKSLCYQLPIVDAAVRRSKDTALLVFPTKALANDQLRSLRSWLVPGLRAVTYDGDTASDDRAWARKQATVVLTNPEMLHQAILPYHAQWATFLMRLRLVVVDELHSLRGIFGSNVAHVLRRLRRVCAHYGSDPSFCFASATIGNPGELASTLCGHDVVTIDDDGAPRSARCFALWQRPLLDQETGVRASANRETAELLSRFVEAGAPTLAFTRSRRGAELVAAQARRALARRAPEGAKRVAAYRAGYLPQERRDLERKLTSGELLGVAATNALELGIDVGGLDAVVLNGFPGTLASMRQQAGRAGRAGKRSAAVLVAGDDQLDQWYATHPEELFHRRAEEAVVNPGNAFVRTPHVACAAHELPLTTEDERWFGDDLESSVRELVARDELVARGGKMYWAGREPPAPRIGLRTGSAIEYQLYGDDDGAGQLIGTVDGSRVCSVVHEGALYLHQGRQWRVTRLDMRAHVARLVPADDVDEYTLPREETDIDIDETDERVALLGGWAHLGSVTVTNQTLAYQRKRISTGETIEVVPLDLPPQALPTRACWYTMRTETLEAAGVAPSRVLGAVHAAEHALIGLLPLFAICDRWDVGGVSMARHPATGMPTIFVYDGFPGGAGIAELAFEDVGAHLGAAAERIASCPCEAGCPSCVQSPKCGNWNEHLDKDAARRLLDTLRSG